MMDANLRGIPTGSLIWVMFSGPANRYGDSTGIIAGIYKCKVDIQSEEETAITVYNPQFRKEPTVDSVQVYNRDVGGRWVTYEGHIDEVI